MKRAAEHQLTREELDAGTDEAVSENPSHFERAAPDVLAKRRILKVRRGLATQPSQTPAAKPNPFAALQVPKAPVVASAPPAPPAPQSAPSDKVEDAAAAKAPDVAREPSEDTPQSNAPPPASSGADAADVSAPPPPKPAQTSVPDAPTQTATAVEAESAPPTVDKPHSAKAESADKKDEKAAHEHAHSAEADASDKRVSAAVPSVVTENAVDDEKAKQQAESSSAKQNGTAVAKSESDNVAEKESGENATAAESEDSKRAAVNAGETAHGAKTYTKPGSKPAIIFGGIGSSNIKSFATAAKADASFKFNSDSVATLASHAQSHEFKEQPVHSGEEEEETLFRVRAKLYSLEGESDKMRWKECGVGALKMNQHKQNQRVRLLMRSEGVLRVVLNTPLLKHVKLDRATDRSIRFQGYDQRTSKCYLLRFATRDACAEFIAAVDKWKESLDK